MCLRADCPVGHSRRGPYAGAPGTTRTCDLRFRKPLLYPLSYGGGDGPKRGSKFGHSALGYRLWRLAGKLVSSKGDQRPPLDGNCGQFRVRTPVADIDGRVLLRLLPRVSSCQVATLRTLPSYLFVRRI